MTDNANCSKCEGELTEGFILDHGHYNAKTQQIWVEGAPEPSFWNGLKTSDRAIYKVRAMRCANCGFLEFYADRDIEQSGGLSELFGG